MHQERTQTATPDGAARAPVPDRDDWTVLQSLSEELALRERILHAVSFAVQRFLREGHWGDGMEEVLARLGEATDVSRIYIFANHTSSDGALLASLRYEWVAEGIEPQIRNPELQDVPFAEAGMGRWQRVLGSGRVISGNVSDFPESERGLLEAQDIRSLLVVPVFLGDRWWGFMGYDECRRERPWSSVVAEALSAAADTLGTAIQRRDTEAALRRSEAQLRQAQKMEALGRLAGGVAHDFNNLLTGIRGYAALGIGGLPEDHPVRFELEEIRKQTDRAASLTSQLLTFSRRQVVEPVILDVNEVVGGLEQLIRRLIGADVNFVSDLDRDLPRIRGDRTQIEQILLNLVVNARDAVSSGGTIRVRSWDPLLDESGIRSLGLSGSDNYLAVAVEDDGAGIEAGTLEHIFEPFFTTKEEGKGTGLGLSMAMSIVRSLGGTVTVNSIPGRGSVFTVFLPVASVREKAATLPDADSTALEPGRETILLVDDSEVVREVARRVLSAAGYTVLTAASGPGALELGTRHAGAIDLLLTDVVLPGLQGREVAESLLEKRPTLKVVYMSGYSSGDVLPRSIREAPGRFIQKPFSPSDLTRRLRLALDSATTAA